MVSPCYDLSQLESGFIRFYLAYELEVNYDYLYLQYSIDGGLNWVNLDVYNGFDSNLKEYNYPISQSMLNESVIFRFHLISDQYVNEEGAVIDDFIIEGVSLNIENDIEIDNIYILIQQQDFLPLTQMGILNLNKLKFIPFRAR